MLELEALLQQSKIVDLSQPMTPSMPKFFVHVPFSFTLNIRHSDLDIPGGFFQPVVFQHGRE